MQRTHHCNGIVLKLDEFSCQAASSRSVRIMLNGFHVFASERVHLCRSPLLAGAAVVLAPPPAYIDAHAISQALQVLDAEVHAALVANPAHPDCAHVASALQDARSSAAAACAPFVWEDGPLVKAMREGSVLLIDEVNLAEDAVLERLNSVLEPGRTLLLAEKGGPEPEQIIAAEGFRVVATMNPGGDHGKRELSPALSNRFTQVRAEQLPCHCPTSSDLCGMWRQLQCFACKPHSGLRGARPPF